MDTNKILKAIFDEVLKEVRENENFRARFCKVLDARGIIPKKKGRRSHRRQPGPFDPIEVYKQGATVLESRLDSLDLEQLKDIIAEHGMDRTKLAMKWKTKSRLIQLIVESVKNRVQKGDAFRGPDSEKEIF